MERTSVLQCVCFVQRARPPAFAAFFSTNPFIVFVLSLSLSLSLVHLKLLLLLFVSGASGQHVEIQIQLPPGFESFGADDIRFSQTNNFATVIFFCFSSYTSSCTFLAMYVVKFCLLSFFLVMNMSEVRNQSSFCRVLVI
jgi:hypothetical protein